MFNDKLTNLFDSNKESNQFIKEALKESHVTESKNGAKKYDTSGDNFVDNFAAISYFKEPREYDEVAKDMELLWSQDPLLCLKLSVYIRMITRKSKVIKNDGFIEELKVQRGAGLKHEGLMRMLWLAVNQPSTFKANIYIFISAGCWKDIIKMLSLDLQYNGWKDRKLDWSFLFLVILAGLNNPDTADLVCKYLPTIRTNKNCKTIESQANTLVGRWLARKLFPESDITEATLRYKKLKSKGNAHKWQQQISKQLYNQIRFDKIAGRALAILVGSKFLENHNLQDKYLEWIKSQPVAKYTGYVFELFKPLGSGYYCKHIEPYKEYTINAQFAQLVKTGKEGVNTNSKLLVVRDTSASMTYKARGCNVSSFDIAKSMALYFSEFLTGPFANSFAEFSNTCKLHQWKGNTPVDKCVNDKCACIGNTDFQTVIDLLISIKEKGVSEKDFPTGLLLISDNELDPARKGWKAEHANDSSNFQTAISRLREAGFSNEYVSNFKIIMWDIPNDCYGDNKVKFEDFADAPNFFYLSGYDPSVISFILGTESKKETPKNAEELFLEAMNQELLNMLVIK